MDDYFSVQMKAVVKTLDPYDPTRVVKIKTIPGHKWHPDKKHWSFPNTEGTLEKILNAFEGEEIHIDPALQAKLPKTPPSHCEAKPPRLSLQGRLGSLKEPGLAGTYQQGQLKRF